MTGARGGEIRVFAESGDEGWSDVTKKGASRRGEAEGTAPLADGPI